MGKKIYNIRIYSIRFMSGWLFLLLFYIFLHFQNFSTISVFLLYLRKTYFKTRHAEIELARSIKTIQNNLFD